MQKLCRAVLLIFILSCRAPESLCFSTLARPFFPQTSGRIRSAMLPALSRRLRSERSFLHLNMQQNPYQSEKHEAEGVDDVYTFFNLVKAIVGAGSFALPWVCKNEGVLGGTLTIIISGILAAHTMKQLVKCKNHVSTMSSSSVQTDLSYVDVARAAYGDAGARFVFFCTVTASLGVCSAYVAFIGTTLETLATQEGLVKTLFEGTSKDLFQLATVAILYPITCLRSFRFLSFTSTLGTISVFAALAAVSLHVLAEQGGLSQTASAIAELPWWPESAGAYFQSFGSVAFLFCINFLVLPVERAMRRPAQFPRSVDAAVAVTILANAAFGALALSLYREGTLDIVTNNLGPGPLLEAVRLLLCVDLLFTYPLVFVTGREIVEGWLLGPAAGKASAARGSDRDPPTRTAGGGSRTVELKDAAFPSAGGSINASSGAAGSGAAAGGGDGITPPATSLPEWPTAAGAGAARPRRRTADVEMAAVFAGGAEPADEDDEGSLFGKGQAAAGGGGGGEENWWGGGRGMLVGGEAAGVRLGLVGMTLALAHFKGFGLITNVVGGFSQGALAFVIPPAAVALSVVGAGSAALVVYMSLFY